MIGLYVSVPIACWRRGHAREYLETEVLPPPSTAYGFLLSLVGEVDRERHVGARVTSGIFGRPAVSRVLRTTWRVKSRKVASGVGENARPDWQELVTGAEVAIFVAPGGERRAPSLADRVGRALEAPSSVTRFGGLSLGESTHLVDVVRLLGERDLARGPLVFAREEKGDRTMPVWVDHVGSAGTRHEVGRLEARTAPPRDEELFEIRPPT